MQCELLSSSPGPKLVLVYCSTSFLPCSVFPCNNNLQEHKSARADTDPPLVNASPLEAVYHWHRRGKRKKKHYSLLTTLVGRLIFEIPCRRCTNILVKLLCSSCYVPLWDAVLIHEGCQSCMLFLPEIGWVYRDSLFPLRGTGTMGFDGWHSDWNCVQAMPALVLIPLHTMQRFSYNHGWRGILSGAVTFSWQINVLWKKC